MGGGQEGRVAAGGHELGDELLGVGGAYERLPHQDHVGAGAGVLHDVVGTITLALYRLARRTISGRLQTSPSILKTPSTTISLILSGSHCWSRFSREPISLCLYFNFVLNERRIPSMIEA